jgi:hypothetical protein
MRDTIAVEVSDVKKKVWDKNENEQSSKAGAS